MDNYKCPISDMSKYFPKKINVVTIKCFYGLPVFLFLFFCDDKKIFILKKYLELLSLSKLLSNVSNRKIAKKSQKI